MKVRKLILSILVLALVVCALPMLIAEADATSVSQSEAVAWARSKVGTGLDYDGAYGNQCTDFIYYYYQYLGVSPIIDGQLGNACDYISNSLPTGWTRISSNITPKPGDIAVYKTYLTTANGTQITSWAGHVGVVTEGNSSTFSLVHQNYAGYTTCMEKSGVPTSYLACVIRPNFEGASTPSDPWLAWWEDANLHKIYSTNAVLAAWINMNIDNSAVTQCGVYLYDYKGAQLATKTENINFGGHTEMQIWYDVNQELGYTLKPGTPYQHMFFLVIHGKTYYSPLYTFTTTGTHSHQYDGGTVTKNPTCGETGIWTYICKTCGDTKTESISKLTTHTWNSGTITKQPTCKEAGVRTYTCNICGGTKTESIAKLTTHSYGSWTKVDNNTHKHTCSVCQNIETASHSWNSGTVTKQPTCKETGVRTFTCTACGGTKTESIAKLTTHTWNSGSITKEPTCKEAGVRTYTCTTCSGTKTESIAKLTTHTYDNACDTACNICGNKRTVSHQYDSQWLQNETNHWHQCGICNNKMDVATHTPGAAATETTAQTCTQCGYVIKAALGHTHQYSSSWSKDSGYHWQACACGARQNVSAHSYTDTCDADCNVCGYVRTVTHNYSQSWTKDESGHWNACACGARANETAHVPGVEATETTAQTCVTCGYEIVPALGHTHTFGEDWISNSQIHWKVCNCGIYGKFASHSWTNGICTVCGANDPNATEPTEPSMPSTPSATEPKQPNNTEKDNSLTIILTVGAVCLVGGVGAGILVSKKKH